MKYDLNNGSISKGNFEDLLQITERHDISSVLITCANSIRLKKSSRCISKTLLCVDYGCNCNKCSFCSKIDSSDKASLIREFDFSKTRKKPDTVSPLELLRESLSELNKYGGRGKLHLHLLENIDKATRREYIDLLLPFLETPKQNIKYLLTARSKIGLPGVITSRCKVVSLNSDDLNMKIGRDTVIFTRNDSAIVYDSVRLKETFRLFVSIVNNSFSYESAKHVDTSLRELYSKLDETQRRIDFYMLTDLLAVFYLFCRDLYNKHFLECAENMLFVGLTLENESDEIKQLSQRKLSETIYRYRDVVDAVKGSSFLGGLLTVKELMVLTDTVDLLPSMKEGDS